MMSKKCYSCEYFYIRQEPLPHHMDAGIAECKKMGLVVDFFNHEKLRQLECVMEDKKIRVCGGRKMTIIHFKNGDEVTIGGKHLIMQHTKKWVQTIIKDEKTELAFLNSDVLYSQYIEEDKIDAEQID